MEETGDAARDDSDYSGEGQDEAASYKRTKRHSYVQIKQLESVFEKNNYVGQKQREELAKKLGMEERQIKFWFRNRRTRNKEENKTLLAENKELKEAICDQICLKCDSPIVCAAKTTQMQYLRFQNMRLHCELQRATAVLIQVTQDANACPPKVFPLTRDLAVAQISSPTINNQNSPAINYPTPLELENWISPNSVNSISPSKH
uniref:Homeobox domain-containing protein n=1 Tax=Leersia perrieri TaxID=77586 RepID=A0A0D9WY80_9ORYZ